MGTDWDLGKYQIEAAAQALESVWEAIQRYGHDSTGTLRLRDINHFLRQVKGPYNGAGHLLLILKSEKTAKGQIAKIAELCKRVGAVENFANEHKVALGGITRFLEDIKVCSQLPREVQALAQEASEVAGRLMPGTHIVSSSDSPKLISARYHHMIRLMWENLSTVSSRERASIEHVLSRGERRLKESKTVEAAASTYKDMVYGIMDSMKAVPHLSQQGKAFKQWLETKIATDLLF